MKNNGNPYDFSAFHKERKKIKRDMVRDTVVFWIVMAVCGTGGYLFINWLINELL